jgi:hypothetical protein
LLVPSVHEYVVAPVAVNEELSPGHIVDGVAETLTVGVGFTVTVTVAVDVQVPLVPVTVYVVVELGVTIIDVPFPPVLQL